MHTTKARLQMRPIDFAMCGALVAGVVVPIRVAFAPSVVGSISLLDVAVLFGVAVLVARFFGEGSISVGDYRVLALILVPFLIAWTSLLWSTDLGVTLRASALSLEAVGAYLVLVNALERATTRIHFIFASSIILGLVLFSVGFWVGIIDIPPQFTSELTGRELLTYYARLSHPFLGRSNDLASVISMFVFVVLAAWVINRRPVWALSTIVGVVGIALTLTRGVMFALALGAVVFVLAVGRRSTELLVSGVTAKFIMGGMAIAILAVIGVVWLSPDFAEPLINNLQNRLALSGYQTRADNVAVALQMISENSLVGLGGGNVGDGSLAVSGGVHNTYLESMVNYGVALGLVASGALVLLAFRIRSYRRFVPLSDSSHVLVSAAFASVVTELLIFAGETTYEAATPRIAFFVAIGLFVSLSRATAREHEPAEAELLAVVDRRLQW